MTHFKILVLITLLTFQSLAAKNDNWHEINNELMTSTKGNFGLLNNTINHRRIGNLELCTNPKFEFTLLKRDYLELQVHCNKTKTAIVLQYGILTEALMTTTALERGAEILPKNAAIDVVAIDKNEILPDASRRFAAKRNMPPGTLVTLKTVNYLPDVQEGQLLDVIQTGHGYTLSKTIQALEDGFIGDTISINDGSDKQGVIVKSNGAITIKIIK